MDWIPFTISLPTAAIASSCLWSLGLYLGAIRLKTWLIEQLQRWLNFAERSLYLSAEEFEKSRQVRESQNLFYASLLSIIPFLVLGGICHWLVDLSLGKSWGISLGLLTTILASVYALGHQDTTP
ncbi:MAG: hypothetical protein ACKN9E_20065 [Microcystaceae cyanobacterium]